MKWGVDSAYPGDPVRLVSLGYAFACGYIGGRALHVWTPEDWAAHFYAGLQLGPIWVSPSGTPSRDQGVSDGNAALSAMQTNHLSGLVVADVESGMQPVAWMEGFRDACHAGSCSVGLYGSAPTINALGDLADTWWLAAWVQSGTQLAPALPDWSMWQYATGPSFDYDVAVDDFQFASYNP